MDRVGAGKRHGDHRMTHLVVRHHPALGLVQHAVLLLEAGHHALDRLVEVLERHGIGAAARGEQGRLVDEVGEIGAGETRRERRDLLQVHVRREVNLPRVHLQDLQPAFLFRAVDQHHAVEAPGAQQRRVEDLRPVGRRDQHQAGARVEAVHFDQQLVQGLLFLVMPAESVGAARPAERVELVDEDDRGRLLPRLLEEIADSRGAHADEHLDEFGAGDREKRHPRLAGDRAREKSLAGSRWPDQQPPLRHAGAEAAVLFRLLQELDHFLQLGLGLIDAGHVGERHSGLVLDVDLGAALADAHEAAAEPLLARHAPGEEIPDAEEDQRRQDPGEQVAQEGAFVDAGVLDVVLRQPLGEVRRHQVGDGNRLAAFRGLELAGDALVGDQHLVDAVLGEQLLELAVGHHFDGLRPLPPLLQRQHGDQRKQQVGKVELGAPFHGAILLAKTRLNVSRQPPSRLQL